MSLRRVSPPRPPVRAGRLGSLAGAVTVTAVTLLGGAGLLPEGTATAQARPAGPAGAGSPDGLRGEVPASGDGGEAAVLSAHLADIDGSAPAPLPAVSGSGRRVVFDESEQRVWLVRDDGTVARTYLVSGSIYDNLDPGTYEVYSRSEQAWGIDGSGTMRFMVRFAHGGNAAIGFHDIPTLDGRPLQSRALLGTATSHGCIRQWRPDARALWRFAPLGTAVVVTA